MEKNPHTLYEPLNLMACLISGDNSEILDFQMKLPPFYLLPGVSQLKSNTSVIKVTGSSSQVENRLRHSPSIVGVLEFLTQLFKKDLGYSSINTARCALSALITCL